ncbi:DNA glycosylase AlkZ-like family protein [Kribbella ginsengisoli]|uniref:Winged helix DNA-binding domain-containing protein n=1 Tax=Kribbella ginsengisoli TaxID=363865 RepID=A0ABP6VMC1_9ACTN
MPLQLTRQQAVAHHLSVNHLSTRLPAGSYAEAARYGLQDTAPRDALVALHARVDACEPSAWEHPDLTQTYSPRAAVYVLPRADFGVFTVGRLPLDPEALKYWETAADTICRDLAGTEGRSGAPDLRGACATGRIALRWTTSALYFREVPRPEIDFMAAHRALCRLHVEAFGPTTPAAFAWWSGLSPKDAREVWGQLELLEVALDGHRAWILPEAEQAVRNPPEPTGARFLPTPDLRLLGQDRHGLFVGPGGSKHLPLYDTFHPNGLLADGRLVGMWGRRDGRIDVKHVGPPAAGVRAQVEVEALSMPIPGAEMTLSITEY